MDQQAKKHLQEEFDAALEEKDQMITVLQTQVRSHKYQYFYMLGRKAPNINKLCNRSLVLYCSKCPAAISSICPRVASTLTFNDRNIRV